MYELVHCLHGTTFSFLTNTVDLFWFLQLNATISSHITCRLLIFLFGDNQWKLFHPTKPTSWPYQHFFLWSQFSHFSLVFWLISSQVWSDGPMFCPWLWINIKFGFIAAEQCQTLDWNTLTTPFFVLLRTNVAPILYTAFPYSNF